MKKKIPVLLIPILFVAVLAGVLVLKACRKDVGEVFNYQSVTFIPDFLIEKADYTIDNESLNDQSTLSFNVTFKNNETTKVVYGTVLNFFVDDVLLEGAVVQNIEANKNYVQVFKWEAFPGMHKFKFQINYSADNKLVEPDETMTTNNIFETSFDIPVMVLAVLQTEKIDVSTVTELVKKDTISGVSDFFAANNLQLSKTTETIKTSFESNVTTFASAIENAAGVVDTSLYLVSESFVDNKGGTLNTSVILEINAEKGEAYIYDNYNKIVFKKDGAPIILKSAKSSSCSEPWFWGCAGLSPETVLCIQANLASKSGMDLAVAFAGCNVSFAEGNECYNLLTDNPPVITASYVLEGEPCKRCLNETTAEEYIYLSVILTFTDDRGEVTYNINKIQGGCESASAEVVATDCGGNTVRETFTTLLQTKVFPDVTCGHQGGSGGKP